MGRGVFRIVCQVQGGTEMNIAAIITALNDSYLYVTILALGVMALALGTIRFKHIKVEVKSRIWLNTFGLLALAGALVLAILERGIK